ncbi:transmembrane protein 243-like [Oscarella lobularis]|uniref:transmembrane protein 243-like n=1 Tax=Oscarella lobularis TaxID=121494 RepID=UPI0033140620
MYSNSYNDTMSKDPLMNQQSTDMNRPLFGEESQRMKLTYIVVAIITTGMVVFTFASAFIQHWTNDKIRGQNVFFAVVLLLVVAPLVVVAYWYRQGTLDPKFRAYIFYNCFTTVLLCVSGNLYFHEILN